MSNNTKIAESKLSSSHSMIDRKTCVYVWTIHSYHMDENYASSTFTGACDDFKWWLELFRSENDEIIVSLSPDRNKNADKCSPLSGNLKITLSNNDGTWYRSSEASFQFELNKTDPFFELDICDGKELKNGLGCSNRIFVWCHVEYGYMKKPASLFELTSLSRDFERIRTAEDFSDVTISVDGKKYPVHKVILAARSSVFKAMFRNDMQENQKNHITITDMEQEAFEEMLHYIYTGEMRKLDEWAFELFPVADKYDLEELKKGCEGILISKLSAENVGKILFLAHMHNAEELKAGALRFIKVNYSNSGNYENTEVWKILTQSCPSLMRDMLAVVFEK